MPIRVVLADDHSLVRQGLKALLEREGFQVVGEASDGQEAVRLLPSVHADVAVLDISMPLLNGDGTFPPFRENVHRESTLFFES